jgi:hypothetical protein
MTEDPEEEAGRHCRCCGVLLESAAAKLLGVCVSCVQSGGRSIPLPPPPGYGFNPWTEERASREP